MMSMMCLKEARNQKSEHRQEVMMLGTSIAKEEAGQVPRDARVLTKEAAVELAKGE